MSSSNLFNTYLKRFFFLFCLFHLSGFSQINPSTTLTFDFNEHEIKEKDDKVFPRGDGITLTDDRFGNEKSAIYLHGSLSSYLNLSSSKYLKPLKGTISLWVNLDRRVYSGKGYDNNPIIGTKNDQGEDFNLAYAMAYDCYAKKIVAYSAMDSLKEATAVSVDGFSFGEWYHLTITFDSNYLSFYLNGKLQHKARKQFVTKYLSTDSVVIGHSASTKNERYCQGTIDDIRIFHRVLSVKEINKLYKAPNPNRLKNFMFDIIKYGGVILVLILIIIVLIFRNRRNLRKQKGELELRNKINELELKVIKGQINPHFISNCLAAIQNLIYENQQDVAGQYIAKFNRLMRIVLNASDKTFIYLSEELEIVELNIELEQLRFRHEFQYQFSVSENVNSDELLIPSLITQPIIENAIWHGLLPLYGKRSAWLNIHVFVENEYLIVEILDNGVGRSEKILENQSKGTKLVHDKLKSVNKISNSKDNKLSIIDLVDSQNVSMGTKVRIQLERKTE